MRKEAPPLNCMKCGREIPLGQVFCKDCLSDMENFPIDPNTPLQLPVQPDETAPRRTSVLRKAKKPEEQIALLKKWVISLGCSLVAVIIAFAVTVAILVQNNDRNKDDTLPGQNYSTVDDETDPT